MLETKDGLQTKAEKHGECSDGQSATYTQNDLKCDASHQDFSVHFSDQSQMASILPSATSELLSFWHFRCTTNFDATFSESCVVDCPWGDVMF
jgi:hypothetical protein